MNALDIVILSIIVISGLYSILRGLIREVFSLLSLGFGFVLAVKFYSLAANYLRPWVTEPVIRNVIGFMVVFIGVSLALTVIGIIVRKVFAFCKLGILDRIFGGLAGLLKGIGLGMVMVFVLIYFLPPDHPLLLRSRLSVYFVELGEIPLKAVPDPLRARINSKKEALLDNWQRSHALPKGSINENPEVAM